MSRRILVVAACPFPSRRGTPLRVQRLAEALIARGHKIEVAAYEVAEVAEATTFAVHRTGALKVRPMPPGPNLAKLLLDPKLARLVARMLARDSFDLVHAHHVEGVLASAAACRRCLVPLIYDAHTLVGSELPTFAPRLGGLLGRVGRGIDRLACALADGVAAVTPDIAEDLVRQRMVAPERVAVAINGVEIALFAAGADSPGEPGTIFYSGTTAAYQDLDLLLRAFARAREQLPSLRLILSLSGDDRGCRRLAQQLAITDAVAILPDSFAELPRRLAAVAVAALPRTNCNGIPQKLLNYMAAARPVVASAGSAKVGRDGEHLLVVPNGDEEAFARAILRLCRDPALARQIGRAARAHVEAFCTWDATAARVEELYDRILSRPAQAAAALREV